MNTEAESSQRVDDYIASLDLEYSATFVPLSQSRNKDSEQPSLNWYIRIWTKNKHCTPLVTDYMQGVGHLPFYDYYNRLASYDSAVKRACSTGKWYESKVAHDKGYSSQAKSIPAPKLKDVIHSLVIEASVLDYSGFEDWSDSYGYDTDSRKAENMYRQCIEIALQLNQFLDLAEAQEVFQDY